MSVVKIMVPKYRTDDGKVLKKPNKVGQDFHSPGIKHPCAIDNRQAQLNESRKVGRWFWPLCIAGYVAIWYLFYLMW